MRVGKHGCGATDRQPFFGSKFLERKAHGDDLLSHRILKDARSPDLLGVGLYADNSRDIVATTASIPPRHCESASHSPEDFHHAAARWGDV